MHIERRADTEAVIAVLAEKRIDAMSIASAQYSIRHWQEIGRQVKDLIVKDANYGAIARERAPCGRRRSPPQAIPVTRRSA